MVAVFSIFATLSMVEFKMMGVGLAAAVLIDATLVRAVLLPATMKLLGDWNWYLPKRLHWLPQGLARAARAPGAASDRRRPTPRRSPGPAASRRVPRPGAAGAGGSRRRPCRACRIGVLTGGGDCPGLNAVIRAIVRKGINQHGHEFCRLPLRLGRRASRTTPSS